jgi:hypothetical protein
MLTTMAFPVSGSQTRGGRKGGLPICECNGLLAKGKDRSPSSNGKTSNEDVAAMPKQFIGQVAMDEQQPSMAFCEDGFLWGQQSMSSMEEDMSCMEVDMFGMCTDFAPATPPPLTGSTATARASKNTRMARPRCMGLPLPRLQIADFEASRKALIEARSPRPLRNVSGNGQTSGAPLRETIF